MNASRTTRGPGTKHEGAPALAEVLRREALFIRAAAVCLVILFFPVITGLFRAWLHDPDLSYGLVVVPVASWILWKDRSALASVPVRGSTAGGCLVALSLLVYFAGHATAINLLQRLALWGVLVGSVLLLLGPKVVRAVSFPAFLLLLAVPPPFAVWSPARIQLKLIATNLATDILRWIGTPAFAEGNVVRIGECRLEVADACSGIRSLMSMVVTAVLLSHVCRLGLARGALLALAAFPATVLVNSLRVVVMAVSLRDMELDLGRGAAHDALGVAAFAAGVGLLYALSRALGPVRLLPSRGIA